MARRHQTQQERSAATRAALIDATIASLVERGYERSSTTEISERAGLSRGAHLHHFHTRGALLAAAAEALAERGRADLERGVKRLPDGDGRFEAAVDMVWRLYNGPLFGVMVELSVHARTDPELRARLDPLERMLGDRELLRLAFAGDADEASRDAVIAMVLATVRGLVVMRLLEPRRPAGAQWAQCRALLLDIQH